MAGSPLCNRAVSGVVFFVTKKLKIVVLLGLFCFLNSLAELSFEGCSVYYILHYLHWREQGF